MDTLEPVITLDFRLEMAKLYLRRRGKLITDPGCTFKPTPSTDRFSILERYGKKDNDDAR